MESMREVSSPIGERKTGADGKAPLCFRFSFSWMVVLINVGTNLIGFFVVQLLFRYANLLQEGSAASALERRATFGVLALLVPAAIAVLYWLAGPVTRAVDRIKHNRTVPPLALDKARRRVLNLPLLAAVMNLVAWLIPAITFPVVLWLQYSGSFSTLFVYILYNFSNALMITLLAFVFLEQVCRGAVIPVLFPEGRIHDQKGTAVLTIRHRLMIMYAAICLIPMLQTALIVHANACTVESCDNPAKILKNLEWFAAVLFLFTSTYGLWLAMLFSHKLAKPAEDIMEVTEKIRAGDYDARVTVTGNDEIGYLGESVNHMARGLKEKERIHKILDLFTSPEISREILSGRSFEGAESRRVTLLFSDLRGFTTMAEQLPPEEVLDSINGYFRAMSAAIIEHGGIILQYVGDEIEAVFGAPLDDPNHADHAVSAALAMRARLESLNQERSEEGQAPFRHGIGIHTGTALAGIVGSDRKISYAMVGDTVNIASRIQELNKQMETDVLISGETYRSLTVHRTVVGPLTVKVEGKTRSVEVFQLVG
jgi:adenylate cyclase